MRIAVIGAGIAGLTVAAGLHRDGHEVTVFEQRPHTDAIGAGLTLFRNAFEALDAIGLGDAVRDVSSNAIASMRAGQRSPDGSWLLTMPPSAVASLRSVHRADLHTALLAHVPPDAVMLGQKARVASDGSPRVVVGEQHDTGSASDLARESSTDLDLVVVADGIRSSNRAALGLDTGLRYSGYTAWRGVTTSPVDLRGEAGETWGRGQIFGVVPLPDERVYWFATANLPQGGANTDEHAEVEQRFARWHAPIAECLAATPAESVLRHDVFDIAKPPSSLTKGRCVLIGDAAHAMTPNLGQGAGQGIEDAATLVILLRNRRSHQLNEALAHFDRLRSRRTAAVLRRSRSAGRVAQASHPLVVAARNAALRALPGAVMGAATERTLTWSMPTASER